MVVVVRVVPLLISLCMDKSGWGDDDVVAVVDGRSSIIREWEIWWNDLSWILCTNSAPNTEGGMKAGPVGMYRLSVVEPSPHKYCSCLRSTLGILGEEPPLGSVVVRGGDIDRPVAPTGSDSHIFGGYTSPRGPDTPLGPWAEEKPPPQVNRSGRSTSPLGLASTAAAGLHRAVSPNTV